MGSNKPLGGKAYGHIPHLPSSRMGPADHSCHLGQEVICCAKKRDKFDRVIVTEKLDGSCVVVANVRGDIIAVGRAGYLTETSPYEHLRRFSVWVEKNKGRFYFLQDGERIAGEWLAMAHGTIYKLDYEPFVPFDLISGKVRKSHDEAREAFYKTGLECAYVVSDGPSISVPDAMAKLGPYGRHGAQEKIEGAVWRVERKGVFDFLAKWVDPTKIDGKYLESVSGEPPVWLVDEVVTA